MPKRKYYRKKYFSKKSRKKYRKSSKSYRMRKKGKKITVSKQLALIHSDQQTVKLRYATIWTDTFTPSGSDTWVFSGNSLYDPDVTGGGNQPTGYDQWMTLYNKYIVRGSKIRVEFLNASSNAMGYVSLLPYIGSSLGSVDPDEVAYAKTKMFSVVGNAKSSVNLNHYFSTRKLFATGVNDLQLWGAIATANPPYPWYWIITIFNEDSVAAQPYRIRVTITYYATLFARVDPLPS